MRRPTLAATLLVATALPIRVGSWIASAIGAGTTAARLRGAIRGIPVVAYAATGVVWLLLTRNGVLYPLFDSSNLSHSWGGPTLIGAWAAHLAIGIAALLVVALPFALWQRPRRSRGW